MKKTLLPVFAILGFVGSFSFVHAQVYSVVQDPNTHTIQITTTSATCIGVYFPQDGSDSGGCTGPQTSWGLGVSGDQTSINKVYFCNSGSCSYSNNNGDWVTIGLVHSIMANYQIGSSTQVQVATREQLGIATTSVAVLCQGSTASSTGFFSSAASDFGVAICYALSFLFVPSNDSVANFSALSSTTLEKFPFSWGYGIYNLWTNLATSSGNNLAQVSIPLHDLGIGSTTAMGNILPNFVALSSTTVLTYMSQAQLDVFKNIIRVVLWCSLALMIFFEVKHLIRT